MTVIRCSVAAAAAILLASGLVTSAAGQAPATEASGKPVPVKTVFPYLDAYLKLPASERSLWTVGYYLRRGGAPAHGVKAVVTGPSGRRPLMVAPDGRITPLPTSAEFGSGAIEFDAPPGPEFGIALKPQLSARLETRMSATEVARGIVQADAGMHKAAGVKAIFLPDISRAVFVDAGSGTAIDAAGRTSPLPGGERPYYQPSIMKGAVTLRFSRSPSAVLLHSANDKH